MKKIVISLMLVAFAIGATSCKSKQSAYKAVYEKAVQQREIAAAEEDNSYREEVMPVVAPSDTDVRPERVIPAQGEDASALLKYSVVIGSFQNITNARSLKERMASEGYTPILAQNEVGMYRVIVTSFNDKLEAARSRDAIKRMYQPLFQDAWILERAY